MTSLNRQRANIVFSAIFETDNLLGTNMVTTDNVNVKFLRLDEAARRERVFERDGILRWFSYMSSPSSNEKLGRCRIGSSMQEVFSSESSSESILTTSLPKLIHIFASEQYILVPQNHALHKEKETSITILLKQNCTPTQQLKAWAHALLVARLAASSSSSSSSSKPVSSNTGDNNNNGDGEIMAILASSLDDFSTRFNDFYVQELKLAGWDLDTAALETRPGRRINITNS